MKYAVNMVAVPVMKARKNYGVQSRQPQRICEQVEHSTLGSTAEDTQLLHMTAQCSRLRITAVECIRPRSFVVQCSKLMSIVAEKHW